MKMKKIVSIVLIVALCISVLTGCRLKKTEKADANPEKTEASTPAAAPTPEVTSTPPAASVPPATAAPVVSNTPEPAKEPAKESGSSDAGWKASSTYAITEKIQALFDKTMEGFNGAAYKPFAFLGSLKEAAGTEYAVLCGVLEDVSDAKPYYALVYIYENAEGVPRITQIQNIAPNGELTNERLYSEALIAGWRVNENAEVGLTVFERACESVTETAFTPIYILGEQMVAGMNYCVLCQCRDKGNETPYYALVYVYSDLQANASVSKISNLSASGKPVADPINARTGGA